jgi:TetR/AcrR family transcriptional regulator, cholesterol catabolism regulator
MPTRKRRAAPRTSPRRVEMYRTAAQIFRDRGFDATSVSAIARALGLTKAGLYHHFDSKEALLFEIIMFGLDSVRDEVLVPVAEIRDPEERLRELILRHSRIITRGRGAVAHIGDEVRALPASARKQIERRMRVYLDLVRGALVELKSARRLQPVDPTVAAFSLIGMILWLPRWFQPDGRLTQEQVATGIARMALDGLIIPARRRRPPAGKDRKRGR